MPEASDRQRLDGASTSPDLAEALEARLADGLWALARQWQLGEFAAEDGGMPVLVTIEARHAAANWLRCGSKQAPLDLSAPLEAGIEAELGDTPPAWLPDRLGYRAALGGDSFALHLEDYDGRALDWFDFRLIRLEPPDQREPDTMSMIPAQLQFKGAPAPRFWEIEDGAAYFDSPVDPEPNILSMLLPEFFYADIGNWYLIPAPLPSGHLRKVDKVEIVDSFGVVTEAEPAVAQKGSFALFALDPDGDSRSDAVADGSWFYAPNLALAVLDNETVEEVRFSRDENANLVWAWERVLTGEDGVPHATDRERPVAMNDKASPGSYFTLKSNTARAFIPYVPRQTATNPAVDGDIALRRARTDQAASPDRPQYRAQVIAEARHIAEEAIPPTGLRVRRVRRFARGSDGQGHVWVGRDRDVASHVPRPRLRFDYIREIDVPPPED